MGWSALVGVGVMVALIPIPAWVSSFMSRVQKQKMQATDRRVKYITEILTVLRMVKEFGWERQVKAQIDTRREEELRWVFRRGVLQAVNTSANFIIPIVHLVVTFLLYTTIQRQRLTASIVFSALTGFNMLRSAMDTFIEQVPSLIQANVSIGRMQVFLNSAELLDRYDTSDTTAAGRHAEELGFAHASFYWSKEHATDARTPSQSRFSLRVEDAIVFKQGVLNLVLGATGCGKTSLLMALLGEMHYVPSGDESWVNLPRQGGVAYCAQEAWIQSMSIKDNILFGAPYEEARYQKG
jgi:ABC-type multidrug transport system fused ATPase/permease subunit